MVKIKGKKIDKKMKFCYIVKFVILDKMKENFWRCFCNMLCICNV